MSATSTPQVSVVMGVYNGEVRLEKTIQSILNQTFTDFEFIIINDGSTDQTAHILENYAAKDTRIQVYHQQNQGLTKALIRGCSLATGEFIARQDAGDVSQPSRLEIQLEALRNNIDAVLVACGAKFYSPENELLFEVATNTKKLDEGLRKLDLGKLQGPPHHGGTVFRRVYYEEVGGYRPHFRVAQDIDLWLRLSEKGRCLGNAEVLYMAVFAPNSISINNHQAQLYYQQLAIDCAKARSSGEDDHVVLAAAKEFDLPKGVPSNKQLAAYHYFLATCLRQSNKQTAKDNLTLALRFNPWHLKALIRKLSLCIK